jgi:predicted MFS family arabinose efflux permease
MLTALQGTSFFVIGSAVIGDIYRPVERSTALGWFLCGSLVGPAIGPVLGGVLTQFAGWRTIFWLQTALAGAGSVLVVFALPDTAHHKRIDDLKSLSRAAKTKKVLSLMSPMRVLMLYRIPNFIIVGAATSALLCNMYSLLVSPQQLFFWFMCNSTTKILQRLPYGMF